jgi:hypothetical protein
MPEPAARRFTMADLMILIAGCAVGIFWTQVAYKEIIDQMEGKIQWDWSLRLIYLPMAPMPILASISLALLVCRLRQPRPRFRRLFRQPGALAMTCVFLMLIFEGAMQLAGRGLNLIVNRYWPPTPSTGFSVTITSQWLSVLSGEVGVSIVACWLLLLAVGRWRAEPTWIDRSGRCLGACWIVAYLASSLAESLFT